MENYSPNIDGNLDATESAPEALGLIEQIKETISGISNYFKLKIKKVLNTLFDWKKSLADFQIELIKFGENIRTVVAYKNGVDYPLVNNFLTKIFRTEGVSL